MKYVLLILVISSSVFSFNKVQSYLDGTSENIIVSYSESGLYFLDHFIIQSEKLQVLKSRKTFKGLKLLKDYKNKVFGNKLKRKSSYKSQDRVTTEVKNKSIWKVKNSWSNEWEVKFSNWLKAEFNKDFFVTNNISTDCADVAFALRWIFARNNYLPAANTLAGSLVLFSQDSMKSEWVGLPTAKLWNEDKLFLKALNYLMLNAYTKTLNIDGYPIELNKDSFLVGTIHLDGGHTMIISEIDYDGVKSAPIWKLSSTVPASVKMLYEEIMLNESITSKEYGGLFRMRWPVLVDNKWELIAKEDMPLYSTEQYEDEFLGDETNFTIALINRLGIDFNPKKMIEQSVQTLKNSLIQRIQVVKNGFEFCKENSCEEGSFNYEEYSTPTRDNRINELFKSSEKLSRKLKKFYPNLDKLFLKLLGDTNVKIEGYEKNLLDYRDLLDNALMSTHPDDSISERWGLTNESKLSWLEKNFKRFVAKREKLIVKCTYSECKEGTKKFKELNTYALDDKIKKEIYNSYSYLQSTQGMSFSKSLKDKIENIPFYLSSPYSDYRWGENRQDELIYYSVKANVILDIGLDYIWADGDLINLSKGSRLSLKDLGKEQYYSEKNNIILSVSENELVSYNLNDLSFSTIKMSAGIAGIEWLGENFFVVTTTDNSNSVNYLFGVNKKNVFKIRAIGSSFYGGVVSDDEPLSLKRIDEDSKFDVFVTNENEVLYQSGNEIKSFVLKNYLSNSRRVGDHLVEIAKESINFISLDGQLDCSIKKESENISYSVSSDDELITISDYENNKHSLYRLEGCSTRLIKTFKSDVEIQKVEDFYFLTSYEEKKNYIMQGDEIIDLKIPSEAYINNIDDLNVYYYLIDNGVIASYFKMNIKSKRIEEMDKTKVLETCKYSAPYKMSCKTKNDGYSYSFYDITPNISLGFFRFYKDEKELFNMQYEYSQSANSEYVYKKIDLKAYDYFRLTSDSIIIFR